MVLKMSPTAGAQLWVGKTANSYPEKLLNLISKSFEHFTDLSFEAGFQYDGDAARGQPFDRFRPGISLRGLNSCYELLQDRVID